MGFVVEVTEKNYSEQGNSLTLKLPGEQVVTLAEAEEGDLDSLHCGNSYTLAFVPFVKTDHAVADWTATPAAAGLVPVDHPVVITPESAAAAEPAVVVPVGEPVEAAAEVVAPIETTAPTETTPTVEATPTETTPAQAPAPAPEAAPTTETTASDSLPL